MSKEKPVQVRNFWIEGQIDGIKKEIATGPKGKDGGFAMEIKLRGKKGGINENKLIINGYAETTKEGERILRIDVYDMKQRVPFVRMYNE